LLSLLKFTVMVEPTVVVAMAAGLASVGAAMELKLTLFITTSSPPPQAASRAVLADSVPARGNKGMPAKSFNAWRREVSAVCFMRILSGWVLVAL